MGGWGRIVIDTTASRKAEEFVEPKSQKFTLMFTLYCDFDCHCEDEVITSLTAFVRVHSVIM